MANIIFITQQDFGEPENDTFSALEHLSYIYKLIQSSWGLILKYENPTKNTKKTKHPPLHELSEDDLKRKLVLNLQNRIDGVPEGECYTIVPEEDQSDAKPDIIIFIKNKNLNISLDIECKKSKNDSNSENQYRDNGVKRFITNKYDKAGQGVGGMIAFALNTEKHPLNTIIERLRTASDTNRISINPNSFGGEEIFDTVHNRISTHKLIHLSHIVLKTN